MAYYALILAAGLSSRMYDFKPLLPLADTTPLEKNIALFRQNQVTPLVITGHNCNAIQTVCNALQVQTVHNPEYASGMFSSVQTGCQALPDDAEAFFILPVDIPLVRSSTIRHMLRKFAQSGAALTQPVFPINTKPEKPLHNLTAGESGHPPLLHINQRGPVLSYNGEGGLAGLLQMQEDYGDSTSACVPVADEGILLDMDTQETYANMLGRADNLDVPTPVECLALWNIARLPETIRAHSLAVAHMAERLVTQLPQSKERVHRVIAGALLHDVARPHHDHALVGGMFVSRHGFSALAPLIESHMDMEPQTGPITDNELVFLADKLIQGTVPTPLHTRYHMRLEQYGSDAEAIKNITARMQRALQIFKRYEEQAGPFSLKTAPISERIPWRL